MTSSEGTAKANARALFGLDVLPQLIHKRMREDGMLDIIRAKTNVRAILGLN